MVRVCNMRWLQNALGPQICNLLRFAHAIAGCDIKLHLFWQWKRGVALRKLSSDANFTITAQVFPTTPLWMTSS